MNCQATKTQTFTLHWKLQSFHVLTESKSKFSVTLIGDSSEPLRYIHFTFRGLALNARFFQENQNSKHSPHTRQPQPDENSCVVASVGAQLPVQPQEKVAQSCFRALHRLDTGWGLPSWPPLPLVCPQGRQSLRARQTLAGQEIVGAGWIWKNSFLAENRFSSKCQGRGGVKMIHKFKHIF